MDHHKLPLDHQVAWNKNAAASGPSGLTPDHQVASGPSGCLRTMYGKKILHRHGRWCFIQEIAYMNNLSLQVNVVGECVNVRNYARHQEWTLISTTTVRNTLEYACCPNTPFTDVTFHLHFKRRSLFYVVNLIAPIVLITLLTIWIFNLPPQTGKKFISFRSVKYQGVNQLFKMTRN